MVIEVEDTYAEAFEGLYTRIIVTADKEEVMRKAAEDASSTPAVVLGRIEGGVESWLEKKATPDRREGALLQFWKSIDEKQPLNKLVSKFEIELSYRIRQDILVKPFTAVFNAVMDPIGRMNMMEHVGNCGDGFQWVEQLHGRNMIVVPCMVPDFHIEQYLGFGRGVMGANFWFMCSSKEAVYEAGKKALAAIREVEGVITPFDICAAGSKPETNFPWIGPTTNHPYCPSLKQRLMKKSFVPESVEYIPEIVINGVSLGCVEEAMRRGMESVLDIEGVVKVSAGNYGGKLGKYKILLRELIS